MAKHMDDKDRGRIEYLLDCGKTITQIAKDLGRPESTVSREIQNRRIDSEKRFGCSNRLCSRFDECELTQFDGFSTRLRKNSARCFDRCPRFFEACCERWAKAPYVCNGCDHEPHCPLRKKYYRAAGAQANYEGTLHASRLGVHVDAKTFEELDRVVSLGVKKGQSVRHIVASNPELFDGISPRTVYDWIHGNLLLAKRPTGDCPQQTHPRCYPNRGSTLAEVSERFDEECSSRHALAALDQADRRLICPEAPGEIKLRKSESFANGLELSCKIALLFIIRFRRSLRRRLRRDFFRRGLS